MLWKRIKERLNKTLRIKTRLELSLGLLVFLIIAIAGVGYLSLARSRVAEKAMQTSLEIQQLVLEMNQGMERAFRLHGDFFLHAAEIGFTAAHEQYAQTSVRQIAGVVTLSSSLKNLVERSEVSARLRKSNVDLNLYLASARRFATTSIEAVELYTELSVPERGMEAQLEQILKELAVELARDETQVRLLREVVAHVQEYRVVRKRFVMQAAFNSASELRHSVERDPDMGDERRLKVKELLDRGVGIAERILVFESAIKSRFNDFVLQSKAVDEVSEKLITLAQEEVEAARHTIELTRQSAAVVMLSITLLGLVVAFIIARVLNQSISRRVERLNQFAGELRRGNLEISTPEDADDELGKLARTFNLMVARISELVTDLELTVEQRTAQLSASEKRFRELFENSSNCVIIYEACDEGTDFIIRDCNDAVESLERVSRADLIGRKITQVFPGVREFGLLSVLQRVWSTGQPDSHPVSYYADGRVSGWRENSAYRLPSGEVVCIYTDCTAQKMAEAEKRAMEVKLQRAQKMEALGLMAGGVAHDLNNILSGVIGFPDILLMSLPPDSDMRRPVALIKESGQRAAAVVSDLLTVARGVASKKKAADLNSLIEEYLYSPEHLNIVSLYPKVECVTMLDENLPPIACSPIHIKKCIMNLVTNAMEAIDAEGHVIISTQGRTVDEHLATQNHIAPGRYVVLSVSDTGNGISEKDIEHIFEPFYSKKIMGLSGTGLGLAVVWNSVLDHAGMIDVKSGPAGTMFSLYFPQSTQILVGEGTGMGVEDLQGHGETVLVVDDEPMLQELAVAILEKTGYSVVCVPSGEEAVAYLRSHRVDLVLLDMIMGAGMNGLETYQELLTFLPGLRAIVISGFSESDDIKAVQALGVKGFVKKPYSFEQLTRAVRMELDR